MFNMFVIVSVVSEWKKEMYGNDVSSFCWSCLHRYKCVFAEMMSLFDHLRMNNMNSYHESVIGKKEDASSKIEVYVFIRRKEIICFK